MTICAIKVCRNYKGRLKSTKNITYHQLPNDPIFRSKWVEIIRKSRGEDVWKPSKCTVICSDHFRAKDLYFTNKQRRRRLKKEAIPCKALFLTPLEPDDDDESDKSVQESEKIRDSETNFLDFTETSDSSIKESCDITTERENPCTTSFMETSENITDNKASGSACIFIPTQATISKIGDERKSEKKSDINEDFSDVDSIYDTPIQSKMRRDLRRRIRLQKVHTLKIQSLRRKNLRLKKKIASLKKYIERLKKEKRK